MLTENDLVILRTELVHASNAIISKKLVEIGEGNISARISGCDDFFITPSYNDYENMNPMDCVRMNIDGTIFSCPKLKKPSNEWPLHAAIYKARPKVNYIIHTHSPYATMMAVLREKIPPILEEMVVFLGGTINIADFGRANTYELANNVVNTLGENNGVLMANHGPVVVGRTIERAIKNAELIEKMAMLFYGASQRGKPHIIDNPQDLAVFRKFYNSEHATY
jgi:L-fuculose-phosphate aldolase